MVQICSGVIEGETRVLLAGMTMEEIFKERKMFKEKIVQSISPELDQFGIHVYNANIQQLTDCEGSEYFKYLRMKTHEGAVNQAKVDVAEARYKGDVGEKERQGQTRREVTRIETETYIYENERKQEIEKAKAELNVKLADYGGKVAISKVESSQASTLRETELQKMVEEKRIQLETERIRATEVAKAIVGLECNTKMADAALYGKQQEALGVKTMFEARANGLKELVKAFKSNPRVAIKYLMLEKNLFRKLAKTNAEAVQGLRPNITVWSTGDPGQSDSMKPIRDIYSCIPPLMSNVEQKTCFSSSEPPWKPGQIVPMETPAIASTTQPSSSTQV